VFPDFQARAAFVVRGEGISSDSTTSNANRENGGTLRCGTGGLKG